eukprot:CAMPEP_0198241696 /NCGR_PEP_ID=MMETSP1446-20131203/6449_1 /TAXON_ID=1461542 ORGANISM="Unidentified sp, Strain CCMP2111" /NCGR_SAMPLE_ID=MMETSP1446 /ASSEMBLY_ACC=CAM_ASM_001112 /LENGTH=361 /DNA_ID=CAMNT_0043924573 /DNA_START=628 /DNA_END=1713 /DNA_ORIENTATION=+
MAALSFVVTFHECGHFAAARLRNIHVSQFSIGFGPCLFRYRGPEVEYSVRLFPFGGFVAFPESSERSDSKYAEDDAGLLRNRPISDRLLVISAGVLANFVLAFGILWGQSVNSGLEMTTYGPGVRVPELSSTSSVARRAGLREGDVITSIGGFDLARGERAVDKVVKTVRANPDRDIEVVVKRGNDGAGDGSAAAQVVNVVVRPEKLDDGSGRIGIQLTPNAETNKVKAANALDGAFMATKETARITKLVLSGFGNLIFHFQQNVDKLAGPVAIVASGQYSKSLYEFLQFIVVINVNLAVLNLLPLPGLDGGYLALLGAEAARGGKKLPENVENGINQLGFLFLLVLGSALLVKDTIKLTQ